MTIDHLPSSPLTVVLVEPQIPPNTGNIARTCAAFKIPLILIEPLGFELDDKHLRRAGLDYWKYLDISLVTDFKEVVLSKSKKQRIISTSKSGGTYLDQFSFKMGDILLFGSEDKGLSTTIKDQSDELITIKMPGHADVNDKGGVRSLNLSIACAITLYQASSDLKLLI